MSTVIISILSSTVIATIITSIISIFNNKKNNSLKYITSERKEWRNEIKSIASEISSSSYEDIQIPLTKLKVQINAYGMDEKESYNHDSHIWELIEEFKQYESEESFKNKKELMISYLSLLLKFDWERTKDEVNGIIFNKIGCVCFIISISLLSFYYFAYWHYPLNINYFTVTSLFILFYFILPKLCLLLDLFSRKKIEIIYYFTLVIIGLNFYLILTNQHNSLLNVNKYQEITVIIATIMSITLIFPIFKETLINYKQKKYNIKISELKNQKAKTPLTD